MGPDFHDKKKLQKKISTKVASKDKKYSKPFSDKQKIQKISSQTQCHKIFVH